jgi:hypothetical protein
MRVCIDGVCGPVEKRIVVGPCFRADDKVEYVVESDSLEYTRVVLRAGQ